MATITRKQRQQLLERVKDVIAKDLRDLINNKRDYSGKEIAERSGLDAARISEIVTLSPREPIALSETTLRKLIGGGFVTVDHLIAQVKLDTEERAYLNKFRVYENPGIVLAVEYITAHGGNPGVILGRIVRMMKKGINVDEALDNILKTAK